MFEFNQEALPDEPLTLDEARKHVSNRIGEGTYYLWEDGTPVALAGHGRHTPHGCSIGPVYTPSRIPPPGLRRRPDRRPQPAAARLGQAVHHPVHQPGQPDLQQHLHENRLPASVRFRPVPLRLNQKNVTLSVTFFWFGNFLTSGAG